jgi:hypothetical protein
MYAAVLVGITIGTGGCIIAIGNNGHSRDRDSDCGAVVDDGTVIAEIDAAGMLFSDSDKADVYKDIARRPYLSGKAQSHLVKSAVRNIFSDASKEEVLLAVVDNPCFADAGKKAVLSNMNSLFSDSRKKRILKAINSREMEPSPVQVEAMVEVTAQTEVK